MGNGCMEVLTCHLKLRLYKTEFIFSSPDTTSFHLNSHVYQLQDLSPIMWHSHLALSISFIPHIQTKSGKSLSHFNCLMPLLFPIYTVWFQLVNNCFPFCHLRHRLCCQVNLPLIILKNPPCQPVSFPLR